MWVVILLSQRQSGLENGPSTPDIAHPKRSFAHEAGLADSTPGIRMRQLMCLLEQRNGSSGVAELTQVVGYTGETAPLEDRQ